MKVDLNCDLGEGESSARLQALMRLVTSVNVACGGHAGDVATMERCVRLAKEQKVLVGAHPGPWSRDDFGRGQVTLTPAELELLLLQQVSALARVAEAHRVPLHHLKLHGSLYHATESDPVLARGYLQIVRRWWPQCVVYARAGGQVASWASREGVRVWAEVFADRAYADDGQLVPRTQPDAVLTDRAMIRQRFRVWAKEGALLSQAGRRLCLPADTVCVHADSPKAVEVARVVRSELRL